MKPGKVLAVAAITTTLMFGAVASAQSLYAPNGKYLGERNANPYDPNSISNPYGRYGNPYSPDSVNNPYGRYGSPFSPDSGNNPYRISPSNPPPIKREQRPW